MVICSDGLTTELTDDEILEECLKNQDNLEDVVEGLLQLAVVQHEGRDNVTAIVLSFPP